MSKNTQPDYPEEVQDPRDAKIAKLEHELAKASMPQYPEGIKPITECSQEELIAEIQRLRTSNNALRKFIFNFVESL